SVEKGDLPPLAVVEDADDAVARRLRLGRDDGDLLPEDPVQERRLSCVWASDQGHDTKARIARLERTFGLDDWLGHIFQVTALRGYEVAGLRGCGVAGLRGCLVYLVARFTWLLGYGGCWGSDSSSVACDYSSQQPRNPVTQQPAI